MKYIYKLRNSQTLYWLSYNKTKKASFIWELGKQGGPLDCVARAIVVYVSWLLDCTEHRLEG